MGLPAGRRGGALGTLGVTGLVVAFRGWLTVAGLFAFGCGVLAWIIALRPAGTMRWTRKPSYTNNLILAGWAMFDRWSLVAVFGVSSVGMVGSYAFRPKGADR